MEGLQLYEKIAAWTPEPNLAAFKGGVICPNVNCGSKQIQWRGTVRAKTRSYRRFQCQKCGKWGQAVSADPLPRAEVK